ncbi:PGPGW domain-containing protein [Protaetiibacter sp. SSC-01]|uniref:PGPGW domain-containing protein n=1 Tax=Protaetiibacter sp. SSC-01 TaxID=2759943 RepID=UPI00223AEAB8|nr:PGPGW domain-containing protein [Protaetiibacter sp. SSC-01]
MSMTPEPDDLEGAPASPAAAAGRMVGSALASGKRAAGKAARGAREGIRRNPRADKAYRTAVGVTGGATVALGVVLMPLPGPGALVALGGLAMLGTEFEGAKRVNAKATAAAKAAAAKVAEARKKKAARRAADG